MDLYMVAIALVVIVAALFLYLQVKKDVSRVEIFDKDGNLVFVNAELADTPAKRAQGLMFRSGLGENEGMLFIFDDEATRKFWMLNTTIALDAIFFSSNGTVVDIIQMKPCFAYLICDAYTSNVKSKYVLEANQGFAQKNNIVIGKSRLAIRQWQ
jgi:uncharacterized membrane protein (UPF0127 family)